MEISKIGFLGIHSFEEGAATQGAILITDTETKPLEFRMTDFVRPKSFQEILYGELMHEYIAVELIGLPLLSALENKPDLVLINNDLFVEMHQSQSVPIFRVMRAEEPFMKKAETQLLNTPDSNRSSAKIYIPGASLNNSKIIIDELQEIFSRRDLLEPFERIKRACIDVYSQKQNK